jgi:hypothetical protein
MLTGTVPIQGLVGCPCKGCIRSDHLVCNLEQYLLCGLGFPSVGITYHYLQRAQVHILAHAYRKYSSSLNKFNQYAGWELGKHLNIRVVLLIFTVIMKPMGILFTHIGNMSLNYMNYSFELSISLGLIVGPLKICSIDSGTRIIYLLLALGKEWWLLQT